MHKVVGLIGVLLAVAGCRGELHQEDGNVEVRLALTANGLEVLEIANVGELPNPPVQGQTVGFSFEPADGPTIEGHVADRRVLRSEFDRAGLPDPQTLVAEHGVFTLRVPTKPGRLELHDEDGVPLGAITLNPDQAVRRSALMREEDILGPPVKVVDHGSSDQKVDLLFLPEGYTAGELNEFHAHVDHIVGLLQQQSGYSDSWTGFNVWRQDVQSRTSGTGLNGTPIETAFDTASGVAGLERCVFFTNPAGQEAALRLARTAGADATIVLVNSTQFGGCAGDKIAVSGRPRNVADVVGHELGHALFGLADEYESDHPSGVCTIGPNVAFSSRLDALPWSDLVNTDELPTPPTASFGTVGAFEGGGYCARGRFRPTHNCMMRTLGAGMCPVCKRELQRTMDALAPQTTVAQWTLTNRTGEQLWARCDGQASFVCSDWTLIDVGESGQLNAPDGRIMLHSPDDDPFDMRRVTVNQPSIDIHANVDDPFSPGSAPIIDPPRGLSPDLSSIDTTDVTLTWSHAGARYFVTVEMETPGGWALFTNLEARTESVTVQLGTVQTRYRWHVEACTDGGCVRSLQAVFDHRPPGQTPNEPNEPVENGTTTMPRTPTPLSPAHEETASTGTVSLKWDRVPDSVYAVNVREYDPVLGWLDHVHEFDVADNSLSVLMQTPATWYAWTVQSCNAAGCSAWSEYSLVATAP